MFESREQAAKKLTLKILGKVKPKNSIVIALPRGAVVMGKIIADYLAVPLDILVTKKIGLPLNPELAIGAVAPKNTVFWNKDILNKLYLSKKDLKELQSKKEKERKLSEKRLRNGKKPINIKGKDVVLVDDGIATGATVIAAQKYLRKAKARKIILAVPLIAKDIFLEIKKAFDEVIVLKKAPDFYAVGQFYANFPQVTDKEVINLLS